MEMETVIRFKRGPYGRSYFGSGGGHGSVRAVNARPIREIIDTGFIRGPAGYEVIDPSQPASVVAGGGDWINDGRSWGESYTWDPARGAWEEVA